MIPEIERITPNFTRLDLPGLTLWFSYDTVVGFHRVGGPMKVSQNVWTRTTGKHIYDLEPDRNQRIPHDDFVRLLEQTLDEMYNTRLEDLARVVALGIDLVRAAEAFLEVATYDDLSTNLGDIAEFVRLQGNLIEAIKNWRGT